MKTKHKMVEKVTDDIRVQVEVAYQIAASNPVNRMYVFAYRIRIKNMGTLPVQLLNRHWEIEDSLQSARTVDGEGVIGQQPLIEGGKEFVYTSGCQLGSEFGTMEGFYEMVNLVTGNKFRVAIPAFKLEVPYKLN